MQRPRSSCGWLIFLVTPLLGGCIIDLSNLGVGGGNDHGAPSGGTSNGTSGGTSGGDSGLSEEQQARKDEADRYIAQVIYKGAPVLQSLQLASGDLVDGLDRSALPDLPYALPALPWDPADVTLPAGVTLGLPDVDQLPALSELVEKAALFHRPDFSAYVRGETDATSVQDYLNRYEVGGVPGGNQLYAGLVSTQPNRGVTGYLNHFQPQVEAGSLSLIEFTVSCPAGQPTEVVGVAISVDRVNIGGRNQQGVFDGLPRLHVEYANSKSGSMTYIWDGLDGMFVANPSRQMRPGQTVPVSVLRGAQVEHLLTTFQAPTGDWWIAYDQDLLGYYPASLFTMLNGGACEARWYGEVYNPHPELAQDHGRAVKTEMGSGKFADAGPLNVAYVRNPKYYDTTWFSVEPQDVMYSTWAFPYETSCYTRSALNPDPVFGGYFFTLGGPGGMSSTCQWPYP